MKTMKSGVLSLLMFSLLLVINMQVSARDYSMNKLHVEIDLHGDGSMWVTEHRSFTFEGRFRQVYRTFPVSEEVVFSNFSVHEGETPYREDNSDSPGSMQIVRNNDELELQINFDARDTTRTFSIRFRVQGAIQRYEDASLLYYQIISAQWTKPIEQISASIQPPSAFEDEDVAHWVHGSLEVVSRRETGGVISLELQRLPAKRFLEIRALYPRDAFPGLVIEPYLIRDSVMEETASLTAEANRLRQETLEKQQKKSEREAMAKRMVLPVSLLYILISISLFRRYGKRPKLSQKPGAFSKLPDKEKPAIVHYLINGTYITGNALISTLFHLAYRNYIVIREEEISRQTILGKKRKNETVFILNRAKWEQEKTSLLEYERQLVEQLFEKIASEEGLLYLKDMKKKATQMHRFFTKWKKKVSSEGKTRGWFDQESEKGRNIGLATGILSMFAFIGLAVYMGPYLLIPAGLALVSIITSLFIFHRTGSGEMAYQQWKSLKQHLKRIDFKSEIENLDQESVNEYLIYGLALGLGPKYFKRIAEGLEFSGHTAWLYWIILQPGSMSSFSKTITEVITTTSSTMSSASGAGGGGTMGGGGGVASGGGGAR